MRRKSVKKINTKNFSLKDFDKKFTERKAASKGRRVCKKLEKLFRNLLLNLFRDFRKTNGNGKATEVISLIVM